MTEKNVGGRPRKYASDAERKKAYRERKKQKMEMLEERVAILEKLLSKYQIDFEKAVEEIDTKEELLETTWMKLAPNEIEDLNSEQIKDYLSAYEKQSNGLSLGVPIKSILQKSGIKINLNNNNIKQGFSDLEENIQRLILIYLMRAELEKRLRIDEGKTELDLLENDIEELEKQITKTKIKEAPKSK
jgi:hypothetical protein